MTKVLAITSIAIRNAMRSRVVVLLLGLLLVAVIALPLTIKGDGTLTGAVQVLLRYTLSAVNIILSVATVWAGCAAISTEVQEHQVHLIVTKPVYRAQLWFGKWLGLLLLNAVLLGIAGVVTYGLMRWNLQPAKLSATDQVKLREEILVARRMVLPEPVEIDESARKIFDEQRRRGELPANAPADQVLTAIRDTLLRQANSVSLGMARRWVFKLPHWQADGRPLILRYKFASSLPDKSPVACMWLAGAVDRPDRYEADEFSAPDGVHTLRIPPGMVAKDGTLTLDVGNVNQVPVTMVFSPTDGVQLLVYEGSFVANLARSLLIILGQLSFLGALSVTMGSLFSLPVAALVSGYGVLLMSIGGYLKALAITRTIEFPSDPTTLKPSVFGMLLHPLYLVLYWVTLPFQVASPLESLAVGELVSWTWVAVALWWKLVVATGVLAIVSTWLFNRRELGLPA